MDGLDFTTEVSHSIKINDEIFKVNEPSAIEHARFEKKFKELSKTEDIEQVIEGCLEYLSGLGLPKEKAKLLKSAQLFKVISFVSGVDKKK